MGGGGAERQLAYLAAALSRLGLDMHVAIRRGGHNLERLESSGATIHRLGGRHDYDPRVLCQLTRLIRKVRPHIVQTWLAAMDIYGGIASGVLRVPWILTERSCGANYPADVGFVRERLRVWGARGAAAIISNSGGGDEYWQGKLPDGVPRYVVPNIVPTDQIALAPPAERALMGVKGDAKVIIGVGRFSEGKNWRVVIAALQQVMSRTPAAALLCGEGRTHAEIQALVQRAGLENRIFLPGYVRDVWGWLKGADVFVSLSTIEGCPNTVLEAIACKCPLVVSDIPAHREFLSDRDAVFVDPQEPTAVADAIVDVLATPQEARRRAEAAFALAAGWSGDSVAAELADIYEAIRAKGVRAC